MSQKALQSSDDLSMPPTREPSIRDVDESLVLSPGSNHYQRTSSPKLRELESALKALYGNCRRCATTTSGIQSISTVLMALCLINRGKKWNLVYGEESYAFAKQTFKYHQVFFGPFTLHPVDASDSDAVQRLFDTTLKGQCNALFVESCSNPNGKVFDTSIIKHLRASSSELTVCVDNTWLSGVVYNPLQHGADVVVSSVTKYYSAGQVIGGFIVSNLDTFMHVAGTYLSAHGVHVSPHTAGIVVEALKWQEERVMASSRHTLRIIQKLAGVPGVGKIIHPSLPDHPSHHLAKSMFRRIGEETLYPSVFTFTLECDSYSALKAMSDCSPQLEYKTSFGGPYSRTDPFTKSSVEREALCRVSVGFLDDVDSTVESLRKIIAQALSMGDTLAKSTSSVAAVPAFHVAGGCAQCGQETDSVIQEEAPLSLVVIDI